MRGADIDDVGQENDAHDGDDDGDNDARRRARDVDVDEENPFHLVDGADGDAASSPAMPLEIVNSTLDETLKAVNKQKNKQKSDARLSERNLFDLLLLLLLGRRR